MHIRVNADNQPNLVNSDSFKQNNNRINSF